MHAEETNQGILVSEFLVGCDLVCMRYAVVYQRSEIFNACTENGKSRDDATEGGGNKAMRGGRSSSRFLRLQWEAERVQNVVKSLFRVIIDGCKNALPLPEL